LAEGGDLLVAGTGGTADLLLRADGIQSPVDPSFIGERVLPFAGFRSARGGGIQAKKLPVFRQQLRAAQAGETSLVADRHADLIHRGDHDLMERLAIGQGESWKGETHRSQTLICQGFEGELAELLFECSDLRADGGAGLGQVPGTLGVIPRGGLEFG
jgi:hypothetical protein